MQENTNPLPSPLSGGSLNPNTKFILYRKELRDRAREFRKTPTQPEKKIWEEILKHKNITGYKFTRQKPLDTFIADFYCAKLLLIIEIDGKIHDRKRDLERDFILDKKYKIKVIRYKNELILNNIDLALQKILTEIKSREVFLHLKSP